MQESVRVRSKGHKPKTAAQIKTIIMNRKKLLFVTKHNNVASRTSTQTSARSHSRLGMRWRRLGSKPSASRIRRSLIRQPIHQKVNTNDIIATIPAAIHPPSPTQTTQNVRSSSIRIGEFCF
jgi:hypothetical protein